MTTGTDTQEKAKAAASATADESKHLGQVAGQEAGNVAGEAMNQVRNLADEAKGQLTDQSRVQRDRLVETMRTFSGDLESMASGESASSGLASDLVRQAADRTRQMCARLEGREPAEILDDVRSFARRRPGTFLLGALAAGIVAGRLARGAKDGSGATASGSTQVSATPAYDGTQVSQAYNGTQTGSPSSQPPATEPVFPESGGLSAPQPTTGPLDEPARPYGDSGPGSL
jgi:hypothetical protein